MKSVENSIGLEGGNVGMMSVSLPEILNFEGAWRYVLGGAGAILGGAMTYFSDFTAGYILLSAGLALHMNGREMFQEAEELSNNSEKIIVPYNESYISSIHEDDPNSGFTKNY